MPPKFSTFFAKAEGARNIFRMKGVHFAAKWLHAATNFLDSGSSPLSFSSSEMVDRSNLEGTEFHNQAYPTLVLCHLGPWHRLQKAQCQGCAWALGNLSSLKTRGPIGNRWSPSVLSGHHCCPLISFPWRTTLFVRTLEQLFVFTRNRLHPLVFLDIHWSPFLWGLWPMYGWPFKAREHPSATCHLAETSRLPRARRPNAVRPHFCLWQRRTSRRRRLFPVPAQHRLLFHIWNWFRQTLFHSTVPFLQPCSLFKTSEYNLSWLLYNHV